MLSRILVWIGIPIALSAAGVIWLSAQAQDGRGQGQPEGIKIGEMAESLQTRESAVSQKETAMNQLERRLNTFQATLAQEQEQLQAREKTLEEGLAKMREDTASFERERTAEMARLRELERTIEQERLKKIMVEKVDEQIVRTYEAMDPAAASIALKELAGVDFEVAVGMLSTMLPKKAAKILDELTILDAPLTGRLSERVGKRLKE